MMKRLFCIMFAVVLMACGFAMAEDVPMAEGADSDWYMAVLTDSKITKEFPYHAFVDVNGDGVPVLIVSTTEDSFITDEDAARVYVYDKGEPKPVMEVGHGGGDKFYCNGEEHTLTHYYRLSGESHIEVYQVKDGALEWVTNADSYAPHHSPVDDNEEQVAFQNGESIEATAYDALIEKYAGEAMAVTYEKLQ